MKYLFFAVDDDEAEVGWIWTSLRDASVGHWLESEIEVELRFE